METTLVVMAAGMGSRFGGFKQAAPITEDGRGILDFSCFDAKKAGFSRAVFILRADIVDDFKALIGDRIASHMAVDYVVQDTSLLPPGRKKPFGTAQAILSCQEKVKGPFAVINADDYYGPNAYKEIEKHLERAKRGEWAMVPYLLKNTLSENGGVNRGICEIEGGYLRSVVEGKGILPDGSYENSNGRILSMDQPVSMNIWGFTPDIFPLLEEAFARFLREADLAKDELYVNEIVFQAIREGDASVRCYLNRDQWYGITYQADLPLVRKSLCALREQGLYPEI